MPLSIIIVGAGIGGLTAALALAAHGHSVKIIEQRTNLAEPGAGLQLSPNVSRLLINLGFENALERLATEPRRSIIRNSRTGQIISEMTQGPQMRRRFGAPYWVIHRSDLHATLLDAARTCPNLILKVGRSIQSIEQDDNSAAITITSTSGSQETLTADIIIGADGVWSKTRKAVGDPRAAAYTGYVAWRAVVPKEAAPEALAGNETGLWLGPRYHIVHYPVSSGRKINIVAVERRKKPVDGWTAPGNGTELLHSLGHSISPELRTLLACPEEWLLWSLCDLPARKLAHGRIALIGDAAHPVLPFLAQGAAMAIEDAILLSSLLAADVDNPRQALTRYENERLTRVQRIQKEARKNGRIYHAGSLVAAGRNFILKRLGPQGMMDRYAWLYGWTPGEPSPAG